nr:response regulator [Butyrivibrio sp.]
IGLKKGNIILYTLLERGLCLMDESTMTNEMYKYTDYKDSVTLESIIEDNFHIVLSVVLLVLSLIVLIVIALAVSLKRTKEAMAIAKEASKAKTTFLFNMSHDIRTPMNAILGFTDLARKNRKNEEMVKEYLDKVKESGDVLMSILNNVLEMARIENGAMVLEETAVDVDKVFDSVCDMFDEQMYQKEIEFRKYSKVNNKYAFCDVTKIREIYLNIISNAYKYTDKGGTVTILLEELPYVKDGYTLYKTTITDTGKGMSKEFLPTLFDEFSREKVCEKNKIEGTGLGMSIVKRFVDFLGGSIDVESEIGKGTTFTVKIPCRIATKEDIKVIEEPKKAYDFTGKRVLLAEDMDVNAEIATMILEEVGCIVDRVSDGAECVEEVRKMPPNYYDVILMDVQMPNLNGYEATQEIRKSEVKGKCDIPIIAMTANAFEEDKKNAKDAGMDGHVGKPIVVDELMKALNGVLG